MINRKILFMTIFSLAAHLAVAAVIVYTPYDMTGNSMAGHQDKVIWGYIAGQPEPVSGTQMMMKGQEIPKTMLKQVQHIVRDDRTDREAVFSSEAEISAPDLNVAE